MSASYTRTDRVLSTRERERFRRDIQERKSALQGQVIVPHVNGAGPEGMSVRRNGRWASFMDPAIQEDRNMINSQIRHLQGQLDKGSPRALSRRERGALERETREDEAYLRKHMVPTKTYYKRSGESGFEKATQAVLKNEVSNAEFQRRANRYKNNIRELDPENPEASNIEKFRSNK